MNKADINKERSLDEALDELDRWSERLTQTIQNLTAEEAVEYFRKSQQKLEKRTGKTLNLHIRTAPHPTEV